MTPNVRRLGNKKPRPVEDRSAAIEPLNVRHFIMIPNEQALFHLVIWAWMRANPRASFDAYCAAVQRATALLMRAQEQTP